MSSPTVTPPLDAAPPDIPALVDARQRVQACIDQASQGLVDRRRLIELLFLALITKEHLLLIGPPGTAKSLAVKRAATAISANYFEYLLGRFSEPNELFGGLDLAALKEGRVQPVTRHMLPEADIAFLDEIFLGSTAILNTLLGLLNERLYTRGAYRSQAPLRSCVGASNRMPSDSMLAAFADRFLLTLFLEPVADESIEALLQGGWALDEGAVPPNSEAAPVAGLSLTDLDVLSAATKNIALEPVRALYAHLIRKMRLAGVKLSDRRIVKAQKLVAAAALLRGADEASPQDLWVLIYLIQDPNQQAQVKDLLAQELAQAFNPVLEDSATAAGYGAEALARDLVQRAEALLAKKPALPSDPAYEIWLVRLETLITSIETSFDEADLPQDLRMAQRAMKAPLDAAEQAAASAPARDAAAAVDTGDTPRSAGPSNSDLTNQEPANNDGTSEAAPRRGPWWR